MMTYVSNHISKNDNFAINITKKVPIFGTFSNLVEHRGFEHLYYAHI